MQTVYPLNENTGLALTTAQYYTPSGRLIQRDYSNISFLDYYSRKDVTLQNPTDVKMTDSGRTVYGGGGITPDEKYSAAKLNRFQIDVLRKQAFFNFTARFFAGRDAKLPNGWNPDQNVDNDFHQFLLKEGVQFSEAEYAENHALAQAAIEARDLHHRLQRGRCAAPGDRDRSGDGQGHRGDAQGQGFG